MLQPAARHLLQAQCHGMDAALPSQTASGLQSTPCVATAKPVPVAEGVYSLPLLSDEFCEKMICELEHFQASGLPVNRPNSMNNYGATPHHHPPPPPCAMAASRSTKFVCKIVCIVVVLSLCRHPAGSISAQVSSSTIWAWKALSIGCSATYCSQSRRHCTHWKDDGWTSTTLLWCNTPRPATVRSICTQTTPMSHSTCAWANTSKRRLLHFAGCLAPQRTGS